MLEDVYKSMKKCAEVIEWKKYNQNDLFYEYIKHEKDQFRDNFYAGIVCRFWGYAGKIYSQCNKHVPFEQCYDIVIDAINYVIQKRVWEDPNSSLYGDYSAPDKAFHVALKRQRGVVLSNLTAQKRQANFNPLSIDQMHEEYNDAAEGLLNIPDICDDNGQDKVEENYLLDFIKKLPTDQIIILDQICYNKWQSLLSVVNNLKKLNESDFSYYHKVYNISKKDYYNNIAEFYKSNQKKLMVCIKRALDVAKKNYINC